MPRRLQALQVIAQWEVRVGGYGEEVGRSTGHVMGGVKGGRHGADYPVRLCRLGEFGALRVTNPRFRPGGGGPSNGQKRGHSRRFFRDHRHACRNTASKTNALFRNAVCSYSVQLGNRLFTSFLIFASKYPTCVSCGMKQRSGVNKLFVA